MSFLSPAAFWTLAALALPLTIHLWRRPPRTVSWGSLRFLQSRPRRLQNLRWREYALLFTRLGLLTALALGLTHPFWRRPPFARPQRWVLLDPSAAPVGRSLARVRALQAAGNETHVLASGFPRVGSLSGEASAPAPDLWSLLREADAGLPAGSSLAVFTTGRLASLRGIRPALANARTEWIDVPPISSAAVVEALPSPPLTVLILHDPERTEDARYVAAAWRAIAQVDKRSVTVAVDLTTRPVFTAHADWIFWLGNQPIPASVAARAANVLDDAAAPAGDIPPGWIVSTLPPVRLWQRGLPDAGSVYWTDGFGQPLLTCTHDAHTTRWHFASRFDPAWNDLPLGAALPAALRALVADPSPVRRDDGRRVDPSQPLPSDTRAAASAKVALPGAEVDLRPALWLGAAVLFCLERLLSHRRAPRPMPTTAAPPSPVLSR